jgi:hypothetical protein
MSAMKDLDFEQEEMMLEQYREQDHEEVAELMNPFSHTWWDLEQTLETGYANKSKEVREAFEYGYKKGIEQGRCLGLAESVKIIKSKREKK